MTATPPEDQRRLVTALGLPIKVIIDNVVGTHNGKMLAPESFL